MGQSTAYAASTGVGWLTAASTGGGSGFFTAAGTSGASATGTSSRDFQVDVPDGEYIVSVTFGSNTVAHRGFDNLFVEAEGVRVLEDIDVPPSSAIRTSFRTLVENGSLRLTFGDADTHFPAWMIESVELASVMYEPPAEVVLQPDLQMRFADGRADVFSGDDIYSTDGSGQFNGHGIITHESDPTSFVYRLQNDGPVADQFMLSASAPRPGWTTRFFDSVVGGEDITADVTGVGWTSPTLATGAAVELRVEVTLDHSVLHGVTQDVLLTATSVTDITRRDAVRARVTNAQSQPDLLVRDAASTAWAGDGVHNKDALNQTAHGTANTRDTAFFVIDLQHDQFVAPLLGSFKVTAPAGARGWDLRYFDSNTDITADITGAGWSLLLGAEDSHQLRVEVDVAESVPVGEAAGILVRAESDRSGRVDAVRLNVERTATPNTPGITITQTGSGTEVSENGGTDEFFVALDSEPTGNVVITIESNAEDEVAVSTNTLVFTRADWKSSKFVSLTGLSDDDNADGDATAVISVSVDESTQDSAYRNVGGVALEVLKRSHTSRTQFVLHGTGRVTDHITVESKTGNANLDVELRTPEGELLSPGQGNTVSLAGYPAGRYDVWVNDDAENYVIHPSPNFGRATDKPDIAALDMDGNGEFRFATDGVLLLAYSLGLRGKALEAFRSPGRVRSGVEIQNNIEQLADSLDLDGDGRFLFATDGVVLLAHSLGSRNHDLARFGVDDSTRSGAEISDRVDGLTSKRQSARIQTPTMTHTATATATLAPLDSLSQRPRVRRADASATNCVRTECSARLVVDENQRSDASAVEYEAESLSEDLLGIDALFLNSTDVLNEI